MVNSRIGAVVVLLVLLILAVIFEPGAMANAVGSSVGSSSGARSSSGIAARSSGGSASWAGNYENSIMDYTLSLTPGSLRYKTTYSTCTGSLPAHLNSQRSWEAYITVRCQPTGITRQAKILVGSKSVILDGSSYERRLPRY